MPIVATQISEHIDMQALSDCITRLSGSCSKHFYAAGLACLCRSAHQGASHPLLLALDDLKLQRSSSSRTALAGSTADTPRGTATAGPAMASVPGTASAGAASRRATASSQLGLLNSTVMTVSNPPGGASPATAGAAEILRSAEDSSSCQHLSRSSTFRAVHTTTTVLGNGLSPRQADQGGAPAMARTVGGSQPGPVQPLTIAAALSSAQHEAAAAGAAPAAASVTNSGTTSTTARVTAAGVSTPSGRRYAAGTAAIVVGAGLGAAAPSASHTRRQAAGQGSLQQDEAISRQASKSSRASTVEQAVALCALQHQQEQLQQMLRQASQRSHASTPSRLSVTSLPQTAALDAATETAACQPAGAPRHPRDTKQPQHPPPAQQLQLQAAVLHDLQQRLADMQHTLQPAISRQDSTASGRVAALADGAWVTAGSRATWVDAAAGTSGGWPSPRLSQPQPYSVSAVPGSCGSARMEHESGTSLQEAAPTAAPPSLAARTPALCSAPSGTGLLESHSKVSTEESHITVNDTAVDLTLNGGVPPVGASACTRDHQMNRSGEQAAVGPSGSTQGGTSACNGYESGPFIEPSSTTSDGVTGRSVMEADQEYFRTPNVKPRHSERHGTHDDLASPRPICPKAQRNSPDSEASIVDGSTGSAVGGPDSCIRWQPCSSRETFKRWRQQHSTSSSTDDSYCTGSSSVQQTELLAGRGRHHRRSASPHSPTSAMAAAAAGGQGDSHIVLVVRQHAKQLQQQNDALVRVLEREQREHKRAKQLVRSFTSALQQQRCTDSSVYTCIYGCGRQFFALIVQLLHNIMQAVVPCKSTFLRLPAGTSVA